MNARTSNRADVVLMRALDGALNKGSTKRVRVDKNLVDAFTSWLADAGVDMGQLDELLGVPSLIDPEEEE